MLTHEPPLKLGVQNLREERVNHAAFSSPMASPSFFFISFLLLLFSSASFLPPLLAQNVATQVLDGINKYRTDLGLKSLSTNAGAGCVAKKLLTIYENQECSNSTGLDEIQGNRPENSNYLNWLSDCNIDVKRTAQGEVLPDCVPSSIPTSAIVGTVVSNYTRAAAASAVNETLYVSAGIAASSNSRWFILILATNATNGDYFQQKDASNHGSSLHLPIFTLFAALFIAFYHHFSS